MDRRRPPGAARGRRRNDQPTWKRWSSRGPVGWRSPERRRAAPSTLAERASHHEAPPPTKRQPPCGTRSSAMRRRPGSMPLPRCGCRRAVTPSTRRRWRWRWPATSPQAQPLAADLEKRYPEDTSVQSSYLPTLRALFSLPRRPAAQAIEQLQAAHHLRVRRPGDQFPGVLRKPVSGIRARGGVSGRAPRAPKPPLNFRRFSITAGSSWPIRWARARGCSWAARWPRRETRQGEGGVRRISSRSGKTRTPTSRFSGKRRQNTPSCSSVCI